MLLGMGVAFIYAVTTGSFAKTVHRTVFLTLGPLPNVQMPLPVFDKTDVYKQKKSIQVNLQIKESSFAQLHRTENVQMPLPVFGKTDGCKQEKSIQVNL